MKPTQPVKPTSNITALLLSMSQTGFQGGRKLGGESLGVWTRMVSDPDCTIFMGLSGAMIPPAGMQNVLIELVKHRYVDVIVSTGANIFHDTCEHLGVRHYLGHHHADDEALFAEGIDRIYDVFAYEEEFRSIDAEIARFADEIAPFRGGSSREFIRRLGNWLRERRPEGRSLVATCAEYGVPIFIPPALCDSSIGIGLVMARRRGGVDVDIDQLADTDEITRMVEDAKKTGVIYVAAASRRTLSSRPRSSRRSTTRTSAGTPTPSSTPPTPPTGGAASPGARSRRRSAGGARRRPSPLASSASATRRSRFPSSHRGG